MTNSLTKIGVLGHPLRPATEPLAAEIAASLQARGLEVWTLTGDAIVESHGIAPGTDMVVAIGGDGAMLRAARLCAPDGVPVLGINVGRLGFLTEISGPKRWPAALDQLLDGQYWIEERMMLGCETWRGDTLLCQCEALNDVVISRGAAVSTVWLETYIDRAWATTYTSDALIIATPTGSTAYALAVGGPILPPEIRNILVVPVAPHLSMERPIVISEGSVIDVFVAPETRHDIVLTVDGNLVRELQLDDRVTVQASDHVSRFIRLRERSYFYRSLLDRLEPRHPARTRPRYNWLDEAHNHQQNTRNDD